MAQLPGSPQPGRHHDPAGRPLQRLSGVLLLKAPAAFRFEALSPFGPPLLVVAGSAESVTVWEVLRNRAYLLPSTPEANRRWLGLALPAEDLVAFLAGQVRPMPSPRTGTLMPPDETGASLRLSGSEGTQRIWLDRGGPPAQGRVDRGQESPARYVHARRRRRRGGAAEIRLQTLDGKLDVSVVYREPHVNTGLDPARLTLTVPQGVEIQDFR